MRSRILAVALAAALAAPALAHEDPDRAMGTVRSVSGERLVIRATDGHEVAFKVTGETRFLRGAEPARPEDVRVGERAVVYGRRAGGEVEAVRVRLGAPPGR